MQPHFHTTQNEHCCRSSMNISCPIYMTGRGLQVSHTFERGDGLSAALQPNPFILFSNTFPLGKVQKLDEVRTPKYLAATAHMCHTPCVNKGCTELEQTVEAAAGSPSHKYNCQVRNYQLSSDGQSYFFSSGRLTVAAQSKSCSL